MSVPKKLFLSIFALLPITLQAQMTMSFPMENAVFQRNSSNQAAISFAGSFTNLNIDKVEAMLTPLNGGSTITWTVVQSFPKRGVFNGSLTITGGWYKLDVRSKLGNNVVETATLNQVGVGEVFIIAGQSNAAGPDLFSPNSVSAADGRVINHNYDGYFDNDHNAVPTVLSIKYPPYPSLSQIIDVTDISKYGRSSWAYGKLGDLLAARLNVPVAFYNAGATGTSSKNWYESAQGLPTTHFYLGIQWGGHVGLPYSTLKMCLNYYASLFGARAVLWHQGETDSDPNNTTENNGVRPDANYYKNNISYVINKSRSDFGATIPWVISQVSFISGNTFAPVIDGQNSLVNNANQIFLGPSTDGIVDYTTFPSTFGRRDGVHFSNGLLIDLASAWNAALSDTFFSNSTPVSAQSAPQIQVSCTGAGQVNLTAPDGYSSYKWVSGNNGIEDTTISTAQTLVASTGNFRCWMQTGQNYVVSAVVNAKLAANSCANPAACSGLTYLSDLNETGVNLNGWGTIEKDMSNGEQYTGDGHTITLKGVTYAKGLGTHANSQIIYNLNNLYGIFTADLGIDDEVTASSCNGSGGTVIYQVYKDNVLAYQSPIITRNSATLTINLNVAGTTQLKLVATDAGDGFSCDHADWAGARLYCVDNQPPTTPANLTAIYIGAKCADAIWGASNDNSFVYKYFIYKNNVLIDSVNSTVQNYNLTNLMANTTYSISVVAADFLGNKSQPAIYMLTTAPNNLTLTASQTPINTGQTITLTASNCPSSGTVQWFNGQTTSSISVSPSQTSIYKAVCRYNFCNGDSVGVQVQVLNCPSSFILSSPTNDLPSGYTLKYEASNTISATNLVKNGANIKYDAAKSITLTPGFKVEKGAVFKAYIDGCGNLREAAPDNSIPENQPAILPRKTKFSQK